MNLIPTKMAYDVRLDASNILLTFLILPIHQGIYVLRDDQLPP